MNPATHGMEVSASVPVLYMALELSNKTWRLALSDGTKRREVSVPAADLASLSQPQTEEVYYARVPTQHSYTVDHAGYVYLLDRAGRDLGFFPPGTPPDRMADVIRPLVQEGNSGSGS